MGRKNMPYYRKILGQEAMRQQILRVLSCFSIEISNEKHSILTYYYDTIYIITKYSRFSFKDVGDTNAQTLSKLGNIYFIFFREFKVVNRIS